MGIGFVFYKSGLSINAMYDVDDPSALGSVELASHVVPRPHEQVEAPVNRGRRHVRQDHSTHEHPSSL
jgi:hypothetical protein